MSADLDVLECAIRDLPDLLSELRGLRQDVDNQALRLRMGETYCAHLELQLTAERDVAGLLADLLDLQPKAGTATTVLLRDVAAAVHRLQADRDSLASTVDHIKAIGALLPAARAVIEFEYDRPEDRGGRRSVLLLPDGNPWRTLLEAVDRIDPPVEPAPELPRMVPRREPVAQDPLASQFGPFFGKDPPVGPDDFGGEDPPHEPRMRCTRSKDCSLSPGHEGVCEESIPF